MTFVTGSAAKVPPTTCCFRPVVTTALLSDQHDMAGHCTRQLAKIHLAGNAKSFSARRLELKF